LFLPFRAVQYDPNGIDEAQFTESGRLFQKNHMLYRPLGYVAYRAAQTVGFRGNALDVLQVMSAVFGAIGVGLCYLLCHFVGNNRLAALVGAGWLGTSFTYWYFSTDAGYVGLAGVLVLAALLSAVRGWTWTASIAGTLAVLTWQANVFAIPLIATLTRRSAPPSPRRRGTSLKSFPLLVGERAAERRVRVAIATSFLVILAYVIMALFQGYYTPSAIVHWVSTYGEGSSLPLWGTWRWHRIPAASVSALRSVVPILLAARPTELTQHVQLGRIAVDIALIAFVVLLGLAALRANRSALVFLAGYFIFLPFIVWWDPYEPKWFLVPNILLAVFLSLSLEPWLRPKYLRLIVVGSVLTIAATNFVTTIRPRHAQLGHDREMAQCVAGKMNNDDIFVSAEWGWSEYLGYLHNRRSVSLINDGVSSVNETIRTVRDHGGNVYMLNPGTYSQEHIDWLKDQVGLTREDLVNFAGAPAFSCYEVSIIDARNE
jgi:hypothetical protein